MRVKKVFCACFGQTKATHNLPQHHFPGFFFASCHQSSKPPPHTSNRDIVVLTRGKKHYKNARNIFKIRVFVVVVDCISVCLHTASRNRCLKIKKTQYLSFCRFKINVKFRQHSKFQGRFAQMCSVGSSKSFKSITFVT